MFMIVIFSGTLTRAASFWEKKLPIQKCCSNLKGGNARNLQDFHREYSRVSHCLGDKSLPVSHDEQIEKH